ncbi:hypothetical protein CBS9595_000964 [Malassezia furfur]|nr:hypothetical protein CBS9595_000964 [Malassezia furfur]
MLASVPRLLHIRPLPQNLRIHQAVTRQAAETAQRATPAPAAPTVLEKLQSVDLPSNVRLVPYVPRKNRFWKVSKEERDQLRAELQEA